MKNLKSVAYHEAGHAVARCIFNHPFHTVRIWKQGQPTGEMMLVKPDKPSEMTSKQLEEEIIISMAGPLAASVCEGEISNNQVPDDDIQSIHEFRAWMLFNEGELSNITKYAPSNDGDYIASMDLKARNLIDEYWNAIIVTAEALLTYEMLTMTEIENLIHLN